MAWPCYYLRIWIENVGKTVFCLSLEVQPVTLTGEWFDQEERMFSDGLGFKKI